MITIRNLSYSYAPGIPALQEISLSVAMGESLGIIGPNGAGKSTLAGHLNGAILPLPGCVTVDGIGINKDNLETIRKKVGLVFQDPDNMLFMPRIIDDVLFGPLNLGVPHNTALLKAERALKETGLWELRDRPPFTLSQGQKRFAAITAVLVMEPSLLVLDEPTSDLDPCNRRKLISLLNALTLTRIVVSHDLDFVWDTCARTILLSEGRIVADGKSNTIMQDKALLERNGLELPLRLQK